MNKEIISTLALLSLLGACVAPGPRPVVDMDVECETYTITVADCEGDKNDPIVDIDTNTLEFDPPIICSKRQKTIKFELNPPPDDKNGTAAIYPKNHEDLWLTGTNVPNKNRIRIMVPNWVSNKQYEYNFVTNTGACVDPRVEVTD